MYQAELGSESVDLHAGAVPGNEAAPDGRMGKWREETIMRGPRWECQTALATARRTGVTEAGFCIATEDRPREGE